MKNLVEQTSLWLRSEACRSGNIIERTLAVISVSTMRVLRQRGPACLKVVPLFGSASNFIGHHY